METIRMGDKYYNAETLTDAARALLGDLQKVEGVIGQKTLELSIIELAKQTLIGRLVEETTNLEEVPTPVEAEAPAVNPAPAPTEE